MNKNNEIKNDITNQKLNFDLFKFISQVIGQEKRALGGFSNAAAMKHTGVLHYCDLVQSCPPHLRRKGKERKRGRGREIVRWSICVEWSGVEWSVGCCDVKRCRERVLSDKQTFEKMQSSQ